MKPLISSLGLVHAHRSVLHAPPLFDVVAPAAQVARVPALPNDVDVPGSHGVLPYCDDEHASQDEQARSAVVEHSADTYSPPEQEVAQGVAVPLSIPPLQKLLSGMHRLLHVK
jgi:hypothetical protein